MIEQAHRPEIVVANSLDSLRGVYATHFIDQALTHIDFLAHMHEQWGNAMKDAAVELNLDPNAGEALPYMLETETARRVAEKATFEIPTTRRVLGIAGPGAAGKGTLTEMMGAPKVINTTTRAQRDYEQDGVHYHFVDENQFSEMKEEGAFVSVTERPGRGNYGIQAQDLEVALSDADTTIIEENPKTLAEVTVNVSKSMDDTTAVSAYVLPPVPVIAHLAARLAGRCNDPKELGTVLESTLGERQVEEFRTFAPLTTNGRRALYVVNDSARRAVGVLQTALDAGRN